MYIFKVLFVFSELNLKVLFTDLCARWNFHFEIGLNEKKRIKLSHDSKIIVQVFNPFYSKFPQIITNLTEDSRELAFTERLERLCLIIILLIRLLSHILN